MSKTSWGSTDMISQELRDKYELSVTMDACRLARDGGLKKAEHFWKEMGMMYPELSDSDIKELSQVAIKAMFKNLG